MLYLPWCVCDVLDCACHKTSNKSLGQVNNSIPIEVKKEDYQKVYK